MEAYIYVPLVTFIVYFLFLIRIHHRAIASKPSQTRNDQPCLFIADPFPNVFRRKVFEGVGDS